VWIALPKLKLLLGVSSVISRLAFMLNVDDLLPLAVVVIAIAS
jgi:hypothetical protein